jgi:DNA-directed RNA polymerase subunit M/transcription elongation factor TFIIS
MAALEVEVVDDVVIPKEIMEILETNDDLQEAYNQIGEILKRIGFEEKEIVVEKVEVAEELPKLFSCLHCGSDDVRLDQLQTRSADEGITTFMICNKCGKRRRI